MRYENFQKSVIFRERRLVFQQRRPKGGGEGIPEGEGGKLKGKFQPASLEDTSRVVDKVNAYLDGLKELNPKLKKLKAEFANLGKKLKKLQEARKIQRRFRKKRIEGLSQTTLTKLTDLIKKAKGEIPKNIMYSLLIEEAMALPKKGKKVGPKPPLKKVAKKSASPPPPPAPRPKPAPKPASRRPAVVARKPGAVLKKAARKPKGKQEKAKKPTTPTGRAPELRTRPLSPAEQKKYDGFLKSAGAELKKRNPNFKKFIQNYLKAYKLQNKPSIAYNIARAYNKLGNKQHALKYYKLSLKKFNGIHIPEKHLRWVRKKVKRLRAELGSKDLKLKKVKLPPERKGAKEAKGKKEKRETVVDKERNAVDNLFKLARGEKPKAADLKAFLSKLGNFDLNNPKSGFKEIKRKVYGTPVRITIARSSDGQIFKIEMHVGEDPDGYSVNLLGANKKSTTLHLTSEGEVVYSANEINKFKFNKKRIEKANEAAEKAEKTPSTFKGKISASLKLIQSGNSNDFYTKHKRNLGRAVANLDLSYSKDKKVVQLPGGFSVVSQRVGGSERLMFFKNAKLICYGINKRLHFAKKIPMGKHISNEKISQDRRYAEIISCTTTLEQSVSKMDIYKGKLKFTPNGLRNFKTALWRYARFVNLRSSIVKKALKEGNGSFEEKLKSSGIRLIYTPLDPLTKHAQFQIITTKWVVHYDTRRPHEIGLSIPGRPGEPKKVSKVSELTFSKAEIKKLRGKEEQEQYKKKVEAEKARARAAKLALIKGAQTNTFKKHCGVTNEDPNKYSFKVDFKGNSREKRRLNKRTKIHDLFQLTVLKNKNKVMIIEITDKEGNIHKGMYYPGQKTVYKLVGGRQTNDRIKFGNGNKISVTALRKPTRKDYDAINKDIPEYQEMKKLYPARIKFYKKFNKLGGKITNLDLTKLPKVKDYFSQKILIKTRTGSLLNWTKENMKKRMPKDNLAILKAEIAVIKEGIQRVQARKKTAETTRKVEKATFERRFSEVKVLAGRFNKKKPKPKLNLTDLQTLIKKTKIIPTDYNPNDIAKLNANNISENWTKAKIKKRNISIKISNQILQEEIKVLKAALT